MQDSHILGLIEEERQRQLKGCELIASENFVCDSVMQAMGSVLTNKYAEGLPGKRYYGGCQVVDQVERLAIERLCQLFGAKWANVQPHSGAQANAAVMLACLKPGDKILGFDLSHGGHLTHGSPANFSGKSGDCQALKLRGTRLQAQISLPARLPGQAHRPRYPEGPAAPRT